MQIFVYEWATGGGLVEEPGPLPASLVREGAAMIGALAADLLRIEGCRVVALRDPRVVQLGFGQLRSRRSAEPVLARRGIRAARRRGRCHDSHRAGIRRHLAEGGPARRRRRRAVDVAVARVHSHRGRQAADVRHAGGGRRAGAGGPSCSKPDEPLPAEFAYPAVLKPVDGAGSQDTFFVRGPHDAPPAYAWPRRLERYMPGLPASVAMLCGPAGRIRLMPCKQRISDDGRLRYLGGELPLAAGLAERARSLGRAGAGRVAGGRLVTWASIWCLAASRTAARMSSSRSIRG